MQDLEQRVSELEAKLAFQDEAVESLNDTIVELNERILMQQRQIKQLADKLLTLPSSQIATQAEETPPPHY
ncbi:SlyX family protein [Ferrimonas aestuarii]|uniref:Protein SlyX homolog n=1 Tax=Ferrimonas aestuarii TaxID=2569539 RepID=A0A4U1BIK0_9GAMM|nr:SlyX family protein [Ferrimonas aestuarii]TKB50939.1 SlyX family protein [Ferrimonas aestuarii]